VTCIPPPTNSMPSSAVSRGWCYPSPARSRPNGSHTSNRTGFGRAQLARWDRRADQWAHKAPQTGPLWLSWDRRHGALGRAGCDRSQSARDRPAPVCLTRACGRLARSQPNAKELRRRAVRTRPKPSEAPKFGQVDTERPLNGAETCTKSSLFPFDYEFCLDSTALLLRFTPPACSKLRSLRIMRTFLPLSASHGAPMPA
jgi:hypothetical protein